jgi:hypothetical protein
MKFKVGDRVKFLNENGGGVVSKIVSPSMVNVAIEDGFEIPVMTGELLKIELDAPVDSSKHMFREDYHHDVPVQPESSFEEDERNIPLLNNVARGSLSEGVYFAFLPHDQKWLITGMLDIYLVNHTPFDILYSIFNAKEEAGFEGFDYGSVIADSMILLDSIDREEAVKWEKGIVQVLFHRDTDNKVLAPGTTHFKINGTRFYKEGNYKDSAVLDGKAIIVSLLPLTSITTLFEGEVAAKEDMDEHVINQSNHVEPEHIINNHKTGLHEAVVDLHIEELIEDHSKMDNSEIIRIQINYFTKCLENAIANNFKKVTFIHGVGTGVLKTAIKEIIKDYPNVEIQDASMKQFGYGAMDLVIRG